MARHNKEFSQAECEAFVEAANPHQWLLVAESLHGQACTLWRHRPDGGKIGYTGMGQPTVYWDNTNRATFLLAAFAMENMIKAFLVYEHPEYVAGGRISGIGSHKLPELASNAKLLPYRVRDRWVYMALAEGNESWARYPCGRDADALQMEQHFSVKLWVKYCDMMKAYASKMERLLADGWTGPYGDFGTWTFM